MEPALVVMSENVTLRPKFHRVYALNYYFVLVTSGNRHRNRFALPARSGLHLPPSPVGSGGSTGRNWIGGRGRSPRSCASAYLCAAERRPHGVTGGQVAGGLAVLVRQIDARATR